jgi:Fe-S-cluster containining protein
MRKTVRGIPIPVRTLTGSAPKLDPPTSRWMAATANETHRNGLEYLQLGLAERPDSLVSFILGFVRDIVAKHVDETSRYIVEETKPTPLVVACSKGCAWCCHQDVEVSIAEAILIAVETAGDARGRAFDEKSKKIIGHARKMGTPCPFLGEARNCTIYDIRPVVCRSFLSPDKTRCQQSVEAILSGGKPVQVLSHGMPHLLGNAIRAGLNEILKDHGLQNDYVDLVQTVAAIRKDPELIDRWANGESVFKPRP